MELSKEKKDHFNFFKKVKEKDEKGVLTQSDKDKFICCFIVLIVLSMYVIFFDEKQPYSNALRSFSHIQTSQLSAKQIQDKFIESSGLKPDYLEVQKGTSSGNSVTQLSFSLNDIAVKIENDTKKSVMTLKNIEKSKVSQIEDDLMKSHMGIEKIEMEKNDNQKTNLKITVQNEE